MNLKSFKPKYNLFLTLIFGIYPFYLVAKADEIKIEYILILGLIILILLGIFAGIHSRHIILQVSPQGIFEKRLFQKQSNLKFRFEGFRFSKIVIDKNAKYPAKTITLVNDENEYIIDLTNYDESILDEISKYVELSPNSNKI